jgi:hypothetical protein
MRAEDLHHPPECRRRAFLLQLTELRRFVTVENAQELDHPHTLSGFRPAHSISPKGQGITGQIVRYLNRSYRVLPTHENLVALHFKGLSAINRMLSKGI